MLRWVQTLPFREEDYWTYDHAIELVGGPLTGGVIRPGDGNQYQVRWGKAKHFVEAYRLAQQAVGWDATHGSSDDRERPASSQPPRDRVTATSSMVEDLERLAKLHADGLLSTIEFETAKRRVLGVDPASE
jgi:hypothetical protein